MHPDTPTAFPAAVSPLTTTAGAQPGDHRDFLRTLANRPVLINTLSGGMLRGVLLASDATTLTVLSVITNNSVTPPVDLPPQPVLVFKASISSLTQDPLAG